MISDILERLDLRLATLTQRVDILKERLEPNGGSYPYPFELICTSLIECRQLVMDALQSTNSKEDTPCYDDAAPIRPGDLPTPLELLPAVVIRAINHLIRKYWNGVQATVRLTDVEQQLAQDCQETGSDIPSTPSWYQKISPAYSAIGWQVSRSIEQTPAWVFTAQHGGKE